MGLLRVHNLPNKTTRSKFVPALVLLLGFFTIATIVQLEHQASGHRQAQLELAILRTDLSQLQGAPLKASPVTGGSPALARSLTRTGKRRVTQTLSALRRETPMAQLDGLDGRLDANFATLDQIIALGASDLDFNEKAARAARLIGVAANEMKLANGALSGASREYERRASAAEGRAMAGTVGAILLLLLAFGLLYRRSVRDHLAAERLARDNARLAAGHAEEARTDALTGLRNRRALIDDLGAESEGGGSRDQMVLGLFDLDGFKQYNDTFGHPAGDALLARLGDRLKTAVSGVGTAYRMGGDEFCILVEASSSDPAVVQAATAALSESGNAFEIGCSHGSVTLPREASSADEALRLADQRLYQDKASGRSSAGRQSSDVLLKVLSERNADLRDHLSGVAGLAEATAGQLGLPDHDAKRVGLAAELHDVGKTAIPDDILNKPGPLDDREWEFMHRHTIIGERILLAAPSLAGVAGLVRSSHERFDGAGYPDHLSGTAIPLGSSIIAVCDAYDAMTSERTYREAMTTEDALAELGRCSGTQFDPTVVSAFSQLVGDHATLAHA
jgi:diguanylate cyclase (GGDEF)-like protein